MGTSPVGRASTEQQRQIDALHRRKVVVSPQGYVNVHPPVEHGPVGQDADPTTDPRTEEHRQAVRSHLRRGYAGDLATKINKSTERSHAAVGLELADPFTSRLEITDALRVLQSEHPYLALLLSMRFGGPEAQRDGTGQRQPMALAKIAEVEHVDRERVGKMVESAIDWLVERIWR